MVRSFVNDQHWLCHKFVREGTYVHFGQMPEKIGEKSANKEEKDDEQEEEEEQQQKQEGQHQEEEKEQEHKHE